MFKPIKCLRGRVSRFFRAPSAARQRQCAYLVVASIVVTAPAAYAQNPTTSDADPVLTPFFRATQIQGHLFGMGLMTIPSYVTDSGIAFPYKTKSGFSKEIPFTDSFSINRMLGGYPLAWLERFHLVKPGLGQASLDYALSAPNGGLLYQSDLVRARLAPYLAAGYKPSDITLALDNVPWGLATPNGAAPEEGPWGRKTPPGDWKQWSDVVTHFAQDLKAYLGNEASQLTFETGIEYNSKASFDGTQKEFIEYYKFSQQAIHNILPGAIFHPGEFAGTGECNAGKTGCSYDVRAFMVEAANSRIEPRVVPRSLQQLATAPNVWPSMAAKAFRVSFSRLGTGASRPTAEIHQFGLLFQPFGKSYGRDPGAMQASWDFQTLMLLLENDPPQKVYHWATFDTVGGQPILNGSGFDLLLLDHYLGYQVVPLQVHQLQAGQSQSESLAVEFRGKNDDAVVVSNFSPRPQPGQTTVSVSLPAQWASVKKTKAVDFSVGSDIFSVIKADLAKDGALKPAFQECTLCEGDPAAMAVAPENANQLVKKNWSKYVTIMSNQLRWHKSGPDISVRDGKLTLQLEPNEVIVISADQG